MSAVSETLQFSVLRGCSGLSGMCVSGFCISTANYLSWGHPGASVWQVIGLIACISLVCLQEEVVDEGAIIFRHSEAPRRTDCPPGWHVGLSEIGMMMGLKRCSSAVLRLREGLGSLLERIRGEVAVSLSSLELSCQRPHGCLSPAWSCEGFACHSKSLALTN